MKSRFSGWLFILASAFIFLFSGWFAPVLSAQSAAEPSRDIADFQAALNSLRPAQEKLSSQDPLQRRSYSRQDRAGVEAALATMNERLTSLRRAWPEIAVPADRLSGTLGEAAAYSGRGPGAYALLRQKLEAIPGQFDALFQQLSPEHKSLLPAAAARGGGRYQAGPLQLGGSAGALMQAQRRGMTKRDLDKLFQNGALGDAGATSAAAGYGTAARAAWAQSRKAPEAHAGAQAPPAPVREAPIAPEAVAGKLRAAIDAQVSKYPAGRKALAGVSEPMTLRFKALDSDTYGYRDNHEIVFDTAFVGEIVATRDPFAVEANGLKDPKRLCRYLASHPDMIREVAAKLDDIYVHEVTHAAQSEHRRGTASGWWKSVTIDNYGKYPVEQEWDAFRAQFQYFMEKSVSEPGCLRAPTGGGALMFKFVSFTRYLEDIKDSRASIAKQYEDKGECGRLSAMASWQGERSYYEQSLAQEDREWPRRSYEGLLLLARVRVSGDKPMPQMALQNVKSAYERAEKYGFLNASRGELADVLGAVLRCFAAQAAKVKPGQMAWRIPDGDIALMRRLGTALGVPVPGPVSNAAVSGSRGG